MRARRLAVVLNFFFFFTLNLPARRRRRRRRRRAGQIKYSRSSRQSSSSSTIVVSRHGAVVVRVRSAFVDSRSPHVVVVVIRTVTDCPSSVVRNLLMTGTGRNRRRRLFARSIRYGRHVVVGDNISIIIFV